MSWFFSSSKLCLTAAFSSFHRHTDFTVCLVRRWDKRFEVLPYLATTFLRQERHTAIPSLTIFPFSLHTPKYSHTTLFVPGLLTNEHREFPSAIINCSLHVHATQIRHMVFGILNNNGNILTTIIGISLKAHIHCMVWTTAHSDNSIPIYRPAL